MRRGRGSILVYCRKKKMNKFCFFFFIDHVNRLGVLVVARRKTRGRQLTRTTDNRADSLIRAETTCPLANGRHDWSTIARGLRGARQRGPQIGTADLLWTARPWLFGNGAHRDDYNCVRR